MADNGSLSRTSLTSSPTRRRSPPQSGQQVPGSSSRRSRIAFADTRGRRRKIPSPVLGAGWAGAAASASLTGVASVSAAAIIRSSSASSNCSISRSIFSDAPFFQARRAKGLFPELGDAQPSRRRRAFSATSGSTGHGRARWLISWCSPPAKPQSSPSDGRDHQGGFRRRSTCS